MVVGRKIARDRSDAAFCESRGVRLNAQPCVRSQFYDDTDAIWRLSADEIRAMHRQLGRVKTARAPLLFAAVCMSASTSWSGLQRSCEAAACESACMAGKIYVQLDAKRRRASCVQNRGPFTPKNIVKDGLEAALANVQRHRCGDCFSRI
jgi:hypothetical protein